MIVASNVMNKTDDDDSNTDSDGCTEDKDDDAGWKDNQVYYANYDEKAHNAIKGDMGKEDILTMVMHKKMTFSYSLCHKWQLARTVRSGRMSDACRFTETAGGSQRTFRRYPEWQHGVILNDKMTLSWMTKYHYMVVPSSVDEFHDRK